MARPRPAAKGSAPSAAAGEREQLQRKLTDLVGRRRYSQALRVRELALRRHPDWNLRPGEAQLWCLEANQALEQHQPKRAEAAFVRALALEPGGEGLLGMARLRLGQNRPDQALALLEQAFEAGQLAPELAGAYLKLLLLQGQEERLRSLLRERPKRFQSQQIHWAAGVLSLLEGNPGHALRQFKLMAAPASPGDHCAVWRAWALVEAGDLQAAASALQGNDHPACAALSLDLAARGDEPPAALLPGLRQQADLVARLAALELLRQLRQNRPLQAVELLLAHERPLLNAYPELASLRRALLLRAGQQALEQGAPTEAIRYWRLIVDRPAFDPDLALRLHPLLMEEGDEAELLEAERLAGLLLSWLRRASQASPADWPEPRLSTTMARLHCWQAHAQMQLDMRQQTRRNVEQASKLAPEHVDVIGTRGLLAALHNDTSTAMAMLRRAVEGGCRNRLIFEALEELLDGEGLVQERRQLLREHGPRFGLPTPPEAEGDAGHPLWLRALSQPDALAFANFLSLHPRDAGAGLDALRIFSDHVGARSGPGRSGAASPGFRRVSLRVGEASAGWDGLLAGLAPVEQVEARAAIVAAILRYCRRGGKALTAEISGRLLQLEGQAEAGGTPDAEPAVRALLLLHGLGLRHGASPRDEANRLLRSCPRPERSLALALLDLRLLAPTRPWRDLVEELRRHDVENPLLSLALAAMEPTFSAACRHLSEKAFELARRQQDRDALDACRREQAWQRELQERERAHRLVRSRENDSQWQQEFSKLDLKAILRSMAKKNGMGELSDADLERLLPAFEEQARQFFARTDSEDFDLDWSHLMGDEDDDGPPQARPAPTPPPRQPRRHRTFMDL
jgi:Flp pilus assembly protein TadD